MLSLVVLSSMTSAWPFSHTVGSVYHGMHHTSYSGALDRYHAWTEHGHSGWKYAEEAKCGNSSCQDTKCYTWSKTAVHVHCNGYHEGLGEGWSDTASDFVPVNDCLATGDTDGVGCFDFPDYHGLGYHHTSSQ